MRLHIWYKQNITSYSHMRVYSGINPIYLHLLMHLNLKVKYKSNTIICFNRKEET